MEKKKLGLLGHGYLNEIVADAVKNNILSEYELVGVMGRDIEKTKKFADKYSCKPCTNIDELMKLKPDFVAEAASPKAIEDYGETILKRGSNIVVLSIGAFIDLDLYEKLKETAFNNNTKIYIANGAVGGFDLLRTISLMGPVDITMTSKKQIEYLRKTPFYREDMEDVDRPERAFTGNVEKIMKEYPYNFNIAMATALAGIGPKETKFNIDLVSDFVGDEYKIKAKGEEIDLDLDIYSKTSKIAAWSVVAVLKNAVATVVF